MCARNCSGRLSAINALTVTRLRSRCDNPGRAHTSPKSTVSVRSASFGATSPMSFCAPPEAPPTVGTLAPYCSSVTFSSHSTLLPSRNSVIARCVIELSGAAPCQCFTPAGMRTTSPGRISCLSPPHCCTRPTPALTTSTWTIGCVCQFERAPGENVTLPPDVRPGALASNTGSTRTVPVKYSEGPGLEGRAPAREISTCCAPAGCIRARVVAAAARAFTMTPWRMGSITTRRRDSPCPPSKRTGTAGKRHR
jgi:hypothetical protein